MNTKTITFNYQPKTIAAITFMEPEKASLLKEYFGGILPKSTAIPTVNLTLGVISPEMKHLHGKIGEYYAIKKSCDSGYPVYTYKNSNHAILNGCIFAYAADLPLSVLRDIMRKRPFIGAYDATMITLEELEENKYLKENNEKLKKILEVLEEK